MDATHTFVLCVSVTALSMGALRVAHALLVVRLTKPGPSPSRVVAATLVAPLAVGLVGLVGLLWLAAHG